MESQRPLKPSSRLIVRGLPKYATIEQIRNHFQLKGQVTDVRLMTTKSGVSRQFAFVGYRTVQEASDAKSYFDRTFMDTSRLSVDIAVPYGDSATPKAWSKHAPSSSAYKLKSERKVVEQMDTTDNAKDNIDKTRLLLLEKLKAARSDPKFQAFASVMQSRSSSRTWSNDDAINVSVTSRTAPEDADYEELKESDLSEVVKPVTKSTVSDLDYLKSKMTLLEDGEIQKMDDSKVPEQEDFSDIEEEQVKKIENVESDSTKATVAQTNTPLPVELIADTGRLFIRNLPFTCTEDELRELLVPFGTLTELHIPIDRETKKPKGFAYVLFVIPENAVKAYSELDGTIFQGRLLHILPASEKRVSQYVEESETSASFKKAKEAKLKATAGSAHNWNTLFMNPDAVMEAVARQLNLEKRDLLNPDSENMAVRVSLSETHIINETKRYLEEQGIVLESFDSKDKPRSTTTLLVKNLTYDAADAEKLRSLFSRHGTVGRVIVPPTRTVAVVEFGAPSEARAAFRGCAYRKFGSVPLYLEWAPEGCLKQQHNLLTGKSVNDKDALGQLHLSNENSSAMDQSASGAVSVFVKNLNFSTTQDTFRAIFVNCSGFRSARIATKKDPKHPGETLSMGFGFVEFKDHSTAVNVVTSLQGVTVDGHSWQLKLSQRGAPVAGSGVEVSAKKQGAEEHGESCKLLVRNIPFEASIKEVKELFKTFGQLQSVRLPKKMNGTHRGFGFITFETRSAARTAKDALSATHLYGRHLVIEWADDDSIVQSLDVLRAKAAKNIAEHEVGEANKRRRIELPDEDAEAIVSDDE